MKPQIAILHKLISLSHEIDMLRERLRSEARVSSVQSTNGKLHPLSEAARIRAKIEKLKVKFNLLKLEL